MTIKLADVSEWKRFDTTKALVLHGSKLRRIRIEFNAATRIRVDLLTGTLRNSVQFLANIEGFQILDFVASGNVHVSVTGHDEDTPDVWYYTAEEERPWAEIPEAVTFTKIANRRARNPELELMMFKMNENINARLERMEAEYRRKAAAAAKADPETGEVKEDDEPAPEAAGDAGSEVSEPNAGEGPADSGGTDKPAKPAKK